MRTFLHSTAGGLYVNVFHFAHLGKLTGLGSVCGAIFCLLNDPAFKMMNSIFNKDPFYVSNIYSSIYKTHHFEWIIWGYLVEDPYCRTSYNSIVIHSDKYGYAGSIITGISPPGISPFLRKWNSRKIWTNQCIQSRSRKIEHTDWTKCQWWITGLYWMKTSQIGLYWNDCEKQLIVLRLLCLNLKPILYLIKLKTINYTIIVSLHLWKP